LRRAGRAGIRSGRIEAYSEVILDLVTETPDMTLCRAADEAEGAQGERWDRHALALLQAPADHAQKKTAQATGQQRSDVKVVRTAWFD
jgi:hypothetical protein